MPKIYIVKRKVWNGRDEYITEDSHAYRSRAKAIKVAKEWFHEYFGDSDILETLDVTGNDKAGYYEAHDYDYNLVCTYIVSKELVEIK